MSTRQLITPNKEIRKWSKYERWYEEHYNVIMCMYEEIYLSHYDNCKVELKYLEFEEFAQFLYKYTDAN